MAARNPQGPPHSVRRDPPNKLVRQLDDEIHQLLQTCLNSGFSPEQIAEISSPLLNLLLKDQVKRNVRSYLKVILLVAIFWGFLRIDWSGIVLSTLGRHIFIQMLPYWDWTNMYYRNCLIQNPYYEHRRLMDDDCQICEVLDSLPRISNASHVDISEDYLKSDVPVIVSDALRGWHTGGSAFSFQNISQTLLDADPNGDVFPCTFSSSLRLRGDNYFRTLLLKMRTENMTAKCWYAHWENCEKGSSKALRRTFPRPYFLPPMVDTTEPNWVFVSSNFRGRHYKNVSLLSDMLWLAQVHGSIHVRLRPRRPCNATCLDIDDVLHEGETLIFTDRMWAFQYLPEAAPMTVAVGGGGSFEL